MQKCWEESYLQPYLVIFLHNQKDKNKDKTEKVEREHRCKIYHLSLMLKCLANFIYLQLTAFSPRLIIILIQLAL